MNAQEAFEDQVCSSNDMWKYFLIQQLIQFVVLCKKKISSIRRTISSIYVEIQSQTSV